MTEPLRPRAAGAKPRVLCVDDEPMLLDAITPHLRRRFDVSTAASGAAGLELIRGGPPFAVVVSDMRMPGMNGAQFLAAVRAESPDTVRVLLTGQAEMDAAIAAVNEGQIFRFLTKPCPSERLIEAVAAAGEQNRLLLAERVLLEQTLQGSIKTLTDILSLNNPLAFGRAARVKQHVTALAERAGVKERWPIEVAAMLAPIGTVTLPPEVVEKLYQGGALTSAEEAMVKRVPAVTEQLLANIPRLEPVREILLYQHARFDGEGGTRKGADLPIGSRLLKLVTDFDVLETQGTRRALALDTLRSRRGWYDPELLAAINALLGSAEQQVVVEEVSLSGLVPGMCFAEDVRSREGALLIARGHEVTPSLIERIRNFSRNVGVREPLKMIRRAR